MGSRSQGDALNQAFTRFKELADRKVQITDADLEAIVAEELGGTGRDGLRAGVARPARRHRPASPSATVVLSTARAQARGHGHRRRHDRRRLQGDPRRPPASTRALIDFQVSSVTGGVDALGDVAVQFEPRGPQGHRPRRVDRRGRGVGPGVPQRRQQAGPPPGCRAHRTREHAVSAPAVNEWATTSHAGSYLATGETWPTHRTRGDSGAASRAAVGGRLRASPGDVGPPPGRMAAPSC